MKGFRRFKAKWGKLIFLIAGLMIIVGYHDVPALWIPMVVVFLLGWILGERSDRRANRK
jgi:hypothetical protein